MLCTHWIECKFQPSGERVRVAGEVLEKLGEAGVWQAYKKARAKKLSQAPEGALMARGCCITVQGLELFATLFLVQEPPGGAVIHLTTKERFLKWQEEMAEENRQQREQEAVKGRRRKKKAVTPGPAPAPTTLRRLAIVRVRWGGRTVEIACSACSLRDVNFGNAGLQLPCLHCCGAYLAEVDSDGPVQVRPFLIPVRYVIGLAPGPSFRLPNLPEGAQLECFEPTQGPPPVSLALEEIKARLADLFEPALN